MITLSESYYHIIERAYESVEECQTDEKAMEEKGFMVVSDNHDICQYYRKYRKNL